MLLTSDKLILSLTGIQKSNPLGPSSSFSGWITLLRTSQILSIYDTGWYNNRQAHRKCLLWPLISSSCTARVSPKVDLFKKGFVASLRDVWSLLYQVQVSLIEDIIIFGSPILLSAIHSTFRSGFVMTTTYFSPQILTPVSNKLQKRYAKFSLMTLDGNKTGHFTSQVWQPQSLVLLSLLVFLLPVASCYVPIDRVLHSTTKLIVIREH